MLVVLPRDTRTCRGSPDPVVFLVSDGFLVRFLVELTVGVLVQNIRDYFLGRHRDARRNLQRAQNQIHLTLKFKLIGEWEEGGKRRGRIRRHSSVDLHRDIAKARRREASRYRFP